MKTVSRLLKYFCNKDHQDRYEAWLAELEKAIGNNNHMLGHSEAVVGLWEDYRVAHGRCFFCSMKLPAARKSTI